MFDFNDWGSWGVGDFYDGNEEELRKAIEAGEPFDTGWHGFKKELQSMRICRDDNSVTVSVGEYMDEALAEADLFYDFLTDDECDLLTDEMIDEIREYLWMGDFVEETEESEELPVNATFEQVMEKASELMDVCSETLHNSFMECIGTTLYVMYKDNPNRDDIVQKRIDEYKQEGGDNNDGQI